MRPSRLGALYWLGGYSYLFFLVDKYRWLMLASWAVFFGLKWLSFPQSHPFDTFLLHDLSNSKYNGGTYHVWVDVNFSLEGIEIRSF
jgi:hypothetical protein